MFLDRNGPKEGAELWVMKLLRVDETVAKSSWVRITKIPIYCYGT